MGMLVTVHFFGHYSDYAGGEPLDVRLPVGARVGDLVSRYWRSVIRVL